jgi:hypothetical protein
MWLSASLAACRACLMVDIRTLASVREMRVLAKIERFRNVSSMATGTIYYTSLKKNVDKKDLS